jgi:hypothetical protein
METGFPYLTVPEKLRPIIGDADPGTRIYRQEGSDEDVGRWFDKLGECFPDDNFVSPGGVSMYVPVSRAGVHKRLKEGKLTIFMFHVVEQKRTLFGYQKKLKQRPYGFIPVSECKAWAEELAARPDRRQAEAFGDGDYEGDFLDKDPKDKSNRSVKYEQDEITAEKLKMLVEVVAQEAIARLLPEKLNERRENVRMERQMAEARGRNKKRKEQQKS